MDPKREHINDTGVIYALLCWIQTPSAERTPFEDALKAFLPQGCRGVDSGTWWTPEEESTWASSGRRMRTKKRKPEGVEPGGPTGKKARKATTTGTPTAAKMGARRTADPRARSSKTRANILSKLGLTLASEIQEVRAAIEASDGFRDFVRPPAISTMGILTFGTDSDPRHKGLHAVHSPPTEVVSTPGHAICLCRVHNQQGTL